MKRKSGLVQIALVLCLTFTILGMVSAEKVDVVPIVVGGLLATPLVHSLCHL